MTKRNGILDQIKNNVVLADGAMGTYAMEKGLVDGDCIEELNLVRPGDIAEIHYEYIRAGAQVILTNSFGANRVKLEQFGLGDKAGELSEAAARIAREAAGDKQYILGNLSSTGQLLTPYGTYKESQFYDAFKEQACILAEWASMVSLSRP